MGKEAPLAPQYCKPRGRHVQIQQAGVPETFHRRDIKQPKDRIWSEPEEVHWLQDSGLLEGRSYTARALTEGDTVKHRFVGHFRLANGLEVYQRSFNVFNLTLWDDIIEEFGNLTDQDVLVRGFCLLPRCVESINVLGCQTLAPSSQLSAQLNKAHWQTGLYSMPGVSHTSYALQNLWRLLPLTMVFEGYDMQKLACDDK